VPSRLLWSGPAKNSRLIAAYTGYSTTSEAVAPATIRAVPRARASVAYQIASTTPGAASAVVSFVSTATANVSPAGAVLEIVDGAVVPVTNG
jgi:hypothetical protein